jgi:hypothetical protein
MPLIVIALLFISGSVLFAQEKKVPKDSSRVSIPGCAKGRTFIVAQAPEHEPVRSDVESGRRFRLSGSKKVLNEIRIFLLMILIVSSLRSALADWNDVPTGSMKPTIQEGDRVVVNKLAYDLKVPFTTIDIVKWGNPKRGDIVVLFSPADGTRLVKRVAAPVLFAIAAGYAVKKIANFVCVCRHR